VPCKAPPVAGLSGVCLLR